MSDKLLNEKSDSLSDEKRDKDNESLLQKGKRNFDSILGVLILNCSMAGIQFTFAIMSTVTTPYNDFLGMGETEKTAINIIGPVCGFIFQPLFGSWSDNCHLKFGRRRIFILGGAVFIIAALCMFAYGYLNKDVELAKGLAIAGMVLLNTSINVMLCPARAIVSDLVSQEAQNKGQIFAAMMMGISFLLCNFIVFGLSFSMSQLDYDKFDECYGDDSDTWSVADVTEIICTIGIVFIVLSLIPTMLFGKEEQLPKSLSSVKEEFIFKRMAKQVRYMPGIIGRICIVFFGSWAGYYPFQMFCSDLYGLQLGALASAIGYGVTFITSLFLDKVIHRIGERNTYKISQGLGAIVMTLMIIPFLEVNGYKGDDDSDEDNNNNNNDNYYFIKDDDDSCDEDEDDTKMWVKVMVCILVGLVGINNAVINSIPFGIVGKFGGESKGLYMGILNCCCVLAQAFSILIDLIWTAIYPTPISNEDDGEEDNPDALDPDSEEYADQNMMSKLGHIIVCSIFSIIGFVLTFFIRNPNEVENLNVKQENVKILDNKEVSSSNDSNNSNEDSYDKNE